ncbi:hypothetical protein [Castellaniella sp.]|uniref:hypothetical protein n=1 Tax=Castellaniella sp. TaxID=1955812 RepID=UPI003C72705B
MTASSSSYYDPPVRFREVYTRADIDALVSQGRTTLTLGAFGTMTDEAREQALKLGIVIQHEGREPGKASSDPSRSVPAPASGPTRPAVVAGLIDAVVAELRARGIAPSAALVQDVVTGVNDALAARR